MEKQKKVTEVVEIKTVEETKEELPVLENEAIEEEKPEEKKEKKDNVFKKLGNKIKTNYSKTKHNIEVEKQIKHEFKKDARCYTVLDTLVKSTVKLLLQNEEESKTFIYLGKLKLKDNSLLKDKQGNLFKITNKVDGEHKREFLVGEEKHIRPLTKYNYIKI